MFANLSQTCQNHFQSYQNLFQTFLNLSLTYLNRSQNCWTIPNQYISFNHIPNPQGTEGPPHRNLHIQDFKQIMEINEEYLSQGHTSRGTRATQSPMTWCFNNVVVGRRKSPIQLRRGCHSTSRFCSHTEHMIGTQTLSTQISST